MQYSEVSTIQPVGSSHRFSEDQFRAVPLEELARRVRDAHRAAQAAWSNALDQALAAGDALIEIQNHGVSGSWKRYLRENCFIAVSTAALYMSLARNRAMLETKRQDDPNLSLRAARRLITKPKQKSVEPGKPKLDPVAWVLAGLKALTDTQLTAVWTAFTLVPVLRTMPAGWRSELERRVAGLRSATKDGGSVLLRESEILRQAVSQMRIAAMPDTAPAAVERAEAQALQALRALANALAAVDIDCTTIVDRYAKEKRCAKNTRRAK